MKYSNIIYKYKKITPLGCKDIDILRGRFAKKKELSSFLKVLRSDPYSR